MSGDVNIKAYFDRIGFSGSIAPTIATLETLLALHPAAIAIDNLDALLELAPPADLDALTKKLLIDRRGGTGAEHNLLLHAVLEDLGYEASLRLATRPGAERPDHAVVTLDIAGTPYLADAGYVGTTLAAPLKLRPGAEAETPYGRFRIGEADDALMLETAEGSEWRPLYSFSRASQTTQDALFAQLGASTAIPGRLRASRTGKTARHTLVGPVFVTQPAEGDPEREEIETAARLKEVLTGPLGIALPAAEGLDPLLETIVGPPA